MNRSRTALLALVAGTAIAAVIAAAVPTQGLDSRHTGRVNSRGFPTSYSDNGGLSLRLCEDGSPKCLRATRGDLVPPEGEALYWSAIAVLPTKRGPLDVEFALEAAFGAGGRPIVFDRLRIRGHLNRSGDYTLLHPYGRQRFHAITRFEQRNVDFTADLPCSTVRNGRCRGHIGHFLRSRVARVGHLGGVRRTRVFGGTARNFLALRAPTGQIIGRTSKFRVIGKLVGPAAVISGRSFHFGDRSHRRTVRIRNWGKTALDFRGIKVAGSNAFRIRRGASTCRGAHRVGSGRTCRIVLQFTPGGRRVSTGRLVIKDNTVAGVHRVPLRGRR